MKDISKIVLSARTKSLMSQSQYAMKLGIHQTTLSKIENGKRNLPKKCVLKIAVDLNMKSNKIIEAWGRFSYEK